MHCSRAHRVEYMLFIILTIFYPYFLGSLNCGISETTDYIISSGATKWHNVRGEQPKIIHHHPPKNGITAIIMERENRFRNNYDLSDYIVTIIIQKHSILAMTSCQYPNDRLCSCEHFHFSIRNRNGKMMHPELAPKMKYQKKKKMYTKIQTINHVPGIWIE